MTSVTNLYQVKTNLPFDPKLVPCFKYPHPPFGPFARQNHRPFEQRSSLPFFDFLLEHKRRSLESRTVSLSHYDHARDTEPPFVTFSITRVQILQNTSFPRTFSRLFRLTRKNSKRIQPSMTSVSNYSVKDTLADEPHRLVTI